MSLLEVTFRDSAEEDLPAVKRYFLDNHSDYNKARGDHVLLERIQAHHFVIIERTGAIVGVAGTFRHGPGGIYREAGATRITLNGFGLQRVTHYARSLHEHLLEPGYQAYYSTVVDTNEASKHNLAKVGWVDWPDPPVQLAEHRSTMVAADRRIDFMRLPETRLAEHAKALLALAAQPQLQRHDRTHPNRQDTAHLDLKLAVLERALPALERLATAAPS